MRFSKPGVTHSTSLCGQDAMHHEATLPLLRTCWGDASCSRPNPGGAGRGMSAHANVHRTCKSISCSAAFGSAQLRGKSTRHFNNSSQADPGSRSACTATSGRSCGMTAAKPSARASASNTHPGGRGNASPEKGGPPGACDVGAIGATPPPRNRAHGGVPQQHCPTMQLQPKPPSGLPRPRMPPKALHHPLATPHPEPLPPVALAPPVFHQKQPLMQQAQLAEDALLAWPGPCSGNPWEEHLRQQPKTCHASGPPKSDTGQKPGTRNKKNTVTANTDARRNAC